MSLTTYRTLGRSGLVVSPLALGAMTFGTPRWGSADDVSEAIFNEYVEAGGNFVDTAEIYAGGRSEELVGQYIANRKLRDKIVLATKFGWNTEPGNPQAGGNGRKNMLRAVDGSLRRLKTDYIDLYWLHVWDMITPVEEVMQVFVDLVRAGKIRYFGFSNVPAWYATKAAVSAQMQNLPGPIALQMGYSLVERNIEREHLPAAHACGLGILPWSPLAAGFLAGKYRKADTTSGATGDGRLSGPNPFGNSLFTDRNWTILETLQSVATQMNRPMAQVALAWVLAQPGITTPIIGASRVEQLHDNLAALEIQLTPDQLQSLNDVSTPESINPYSIFTPTIRQGLFGGFDVQGWQ